jgi:hypothetical protein
MGAGRGGVGMLAWCILRVAKSSRAARARTHARRRRKCHAAICPTGGGRPRHVATHLLRPRSVAHSAAPSSPTCRAPRGQAPGGRAAGWAGEAGARGPCLPHAHARVVARRDKQVPVRCRAARPPRAVSALLTGRVAQPSRPAQPGSRERGGTGAHRKAAPRRRPRTMAPRHGARDSPRPRGAAPRAAPPRLPTGGLRARDTPADLGVAGTGTSQRRAAPPRRCTCTRPLASTSACPTPGPPRTSAAPRQRRQRRRRRGRQECVPPATARTPCVPVKTFLIRPYFLILIRPYFLNPSLQRLTSERWGAAVRA